MVEQKKEHRNIALISLDIRRTLGQSAVPLVEAVEALHAHTEQRFSAVRTEANAANTSAEQAKISAAEAAASASTTETTATELASLVRTTLTDIRTEAENAATSASEAKTGAKNAAESATGIQTTLDAISLDIEGTTLTGAQAFSKMVEIVSAMPQAVIDEVRKATTLDVDTNGTDEQPVKRELSGQELLRYMLGAAVTAKESSGKALGRADDAEKAARTSGESANAAKKSATDAGGAATRAEEAATTAKQDATGAKETVSRLEARLESLEAALEDAFSAVDKQSKIILHLLGGAVAISSEIAGLFEKPSYTKVDDTNTTNVGDEK